ncbi:MAG TPA: hypothetical protein VF553_03700 [Pyrinomonadaceae bacterium]
MVTVLIASFLLLAAISYAIYRRQRASSGESEEHVLAPPAARPLFSDNDSYAAEARLLAAEEAERQTSKRREALLERAAQGDKAALSEANDDQALYSEVLDALVERADNEKKLLALVSYIERSGDGLRVSAKLAKRFLDSWKASPESRSTPIALHLAAMADDAPVYQKAVETVFALWRAGRLPEISAAELRALFDGEYWVLSADVRNSGAGFVLKQKLASLRLELLKASSKST